MEQQSHWTLKQSASRRESEPLGVRFSHMDDAIVPLNLLSYSERVTVVIKKMYYESRTRYRLDNECIEALVTERIQGKHSPHTI